MFEERLASFEDRGVGALEGLMRDGGRLGRSLHVGGEAGEELRVDVREVNVGQLGREEIEEGLDGGSDGVHGAEHIFSIRHRATLYGAWVRCPLGFLFFLAGCQGTTDVEPRVAAPPVVSATPPVGQVPEGARVTPLPVPACAVRGQNVELAYDGIPLQLDDGGAVYATVDRADDAELRLEPDAQGTRATLQVNVGDARLVGWVRRETVSVHPAYLATFADVVVLRRLHVTAVRDADLDTTVTAPAWALPRGAPALAPGVHRCSELSLGPGPASIQTTGPLRSLRPDGKIAVRRAPQETPRLTLLDPSALRPGMQLDTKDGFSRMWLPSGDLDIVGWIAKSDLIAPTQGSPRQDRDPLSAPTGGVRCEAEVPLYAEVGGIARRVGELARGARVVTHGEGAFVTVDVGGAVFLSAGARFLVRRADVATCPR